MEILKNNDPILLQKAKPVTDFSPSLFDFVKEMFIKLKETGGIGLAAPQVGRSERFFIIKLPEQNPYAIFNPEIVATSIETDEAWEGCLSLPGRIGLIERPIEIGIQSLNISKNRLFLSKASGLLARAILHEYDHLEGILITDKAKEVKYTGLDKVLY